MNIKVQMRRIPIPGYFYAHIFHINIKTKLKIKTDDHYNHFNEGMTCSMSFKEITV